MWSARSAARTNDVDADDPGERLGLGGRGGARGLGRTGRVGAAWIGVPPP
jgi:hypothetical protein